MKVLNANQFISERVKVKPVTNADLDSVREIIRKKQKDCLFALWPDAYDTVYRLQKRIEKEHIATTQAGQCIFILKADDIKTLFDEKLIHIGRFTEEADTLYKLNSKLSEKDVKDIISDAKWAGAARIFLDNKENAQQILSYEEFEKISIKQ